MSATLAAPIAMSSVNPLRWKILATMVAAQFMFVVDAFIVNVAIPAIRTDLGATAGEIAAVIAIYQIAYASIVITGGRLGDMFGAKRLFLIGLAGFVGSSLWCGLSHSGAELIVARMAQGASAALMVPQVLGTIHTLFADDAERARAFGIFGVALGLGGAVGYILGGVLVALDLKGFGWRMIFFVNVPVGFVLAVAAMRLMPPSPARSGERLDVGGASLLFIGLVSLLGPIMFGREAGWPAWIAPVLVLGVIDLVLFVALERARERRRATTLIDVRLLSDRTFMRGAGGAFAFFAANISFYLVTTVYLQSGLGFTALGTAFVVVPLVVAFTIASRGAAARASRRGPRALAEGCLIEILGLGLLAALILAGRTEGFVLAVPLAIFGAGQGLVMAPLFATVLAGVPRTQAGAGAGMLATVQQAGNATGVAAIGAIYFALADARTHETALLVAAGVLASTLVVAIGFLMALQRTAQRLQASLLNRKTG